MCNLNSRSSNGQKKFKIKHNAIGVQTDYRESETQTDPCTLHFGNFTERDRIKNVVRENENVDTEFNVYYFLNFFFEGSRSAFTSIFVVSSRFAS